MFNSYVRVKKSEIRELEKVLEDALVSLKELHADVESLKRDNERLENENKFLQGLVDKLAQPLKPPPSGEYNPWEQGIPTWPIKSPYSLNTGCQVCGLKGVNGYVCPRTDCPTGVSCQTK